jgi:hypothetical protein
MFAGKIRLLLPLPLPLPLLLLLLLLVFHRSSDLIMLPPLDRVLQKCTWGFRAMLGWICVRICFYIDTEICPGLQLYV